MGERNNMKATFASLIIPLALVLASSELVYAVPASLTPGHHNNTIEPESEKILVTDTGITIKLPKLGQTEVTAQSSTEQKDGSLEFRGNVVVRITVEGNDVIEILCEEATISYANDKDQGGNSELCGNSVLRGNSGYPESLPSGRNLENSSGKGASNVIPSPVTGCLSESLAAWSMSRSTWVTPLPFAP